MILRRYGIGNEVQSRLASTRIVGKVVNLMASQQTALLKLSTVRSVEIFQDQSEG